jgi:hypothetical protein
MVLGASKHGRHRVLFIPVILFTAEHLLSVKDEQDSMEGGARVGFYFFFLQSY